MRESLNSQPALVLLNGLVRMGLAVLLAYAAYGKLIDPKEMATSISHYKVLPDAVIGWAALAVPTFEAVVAVGLVTPWLHRGSALLCAGMMWVFALAMVQARLRGINLECGCFGADSAVVVGAATIARNVALGAMALWVALRSSPPSASNG